MIGKMIWYAAILLIGAVTTAVQLDRQSAATPTLAEFVPKPARGFAQAQLAARALQSGPSELAVKEAELLVERRPIPAEPLRLLAQAKFSAGQSEAGLLTIQIAARRGWRDPAAQETMLRLAIAAGDEAEAARRYTALFLQSGTQDALLVELGATLFETTDGPAARTLIEIVSANDRWPDTFLRRGQRVLRPGTFVEIVGEAAWHGADFSCEILIDLGPSLTRRDTTAGKKWTELMQKHC
ncbi:hypothetical protein [Erythrobacter crassostreae]|uniref:Uncharacterized protein n=1 Tax=Erythrobacter crassostreae TaxID=2828328 RepID=A0A9X1JJW5_9SPHN|nr:hypothetical protein [Erythrobacter crassostrea]MBV7258296.1 hypothetical protein [Erythrobacter crassostrea]